MKRTLLAIVATLMMFTSASAQRLTDIQAEARFITDKMVVELGLSNVQRNNILNINLTYLDGIRSYRDIDANGWKYRNKQLKRMLTAQQWKRYKDAYYFYRPIGWRNDAYIHHIYAKYPKQKNWRKDGPRPDFRNDKRRPACDPRPGHGPRPDFKGKPGPDFKKGKPDFKKGKPDKHDRPSFGNGRREFDNNSPEAIRMRQDMRRGAMKGAR